MSTAGSEVCHCGVWCLFEWGRYLGRTQIEFENFPEEGTHIYLRNAQRDDDD